MFFYHTEHHGRKVNNLKHHVVVVTLKLSAALSQDLFVRKFNRRKNIRAGKSSYHLNTICLHAYDKNRLIIYNLLRHYVHGCCLHQVK